MTCPLRDHSVISQYRVSNKYCGNGLIAKTKYRLPQHHASLLLMVRQYEDNDGGLALSTIYTPSVVMKHVSLVNLPAMIVVGGLGCVIVHRRRHHGPPTAWLQEDIGMSEQVHAYLVMRRYQSSPS